MLFTINDLGFSIAGLLLEGWLAFAARCVCALALLFIGWVVSRWLQKSLFPRLLKRSWHFAFTHPLLESFARPAARIAWYTGMYLALRSLPWAIPGLAALLLKAYRMMLVFLIGTGFYHASGIAALLLASSSEEVRTNRTLLTLLDKVYKVAVVVLCGATIAQESGLPVGSVVASAGLIGLTISLAAQDMAKNFFSGVVILLDKPFSIGDWITVGDVEGEVVDINFRSTKVRAVDNSIYILTNSTVSSATINNATLRNKRLYRFTLGVTYDTTRPQLEKLMADLDAMLKASPDTYEDTAFVRMTGFGDSSINLMVSAYLRTADLGVFLRMQNDLNLNIMDVMKADGVDFAFPSTTVKRELTAKKPMQLHRLFCYSAISSAIMRANPSTTLMTPAGSSCSTASGIISCAVTQTMHPAAALISQGRAACTQPARASASSAPSGSTRPDAAPAQKAFRLPCPACTSGRLTAAPSGIFCKPMPSARASAPLTAAASPTTMPSGRLWRVTASTTRPIRPCSFDPVCISRPAASSSRSRPTAPSTNPAAGASQTGSIPASALSMAGSSRLHTLAASMMPAAMPQSIRRVRGSSARRTRKTPAAPSAVQSAGSSRMTAANR